MSATCPCGAQAHHRRVLGAGPDLVCRPCLDALFRRGTPLDLTYEPLPSPVFHFDHGRPGSDPAVLRGHAALLDVGPRVGEALVSARLLREAATEIERLTIRAGAA